MDSITGTTEKGRSFLKFICAINIVLSVTINTSRNAVACEQPLYIMSSEVRITNNCHGGVIMTEIKGS